MGYALDVGFRYLRSKKRATVSVISIIAVTGVALGVGALLSVVSITSGFQDEFRNKVLGVNAHVLVLKYGLNFDEYRDVVALAERQPEVRGAAPFIINEMMLAKGDRLGGVLIKGIDPTEAADVLDLPGQLLRGGLEGLRLPGSAPPVRPEELDRAPGEAEDESLDAFLQDLSDRTSGVDPFAEGDLETADVDGGAADSATPPDPAAVLAGAVPAPEGGLPLVDVPSVEQMNAALSEFDDLDGLPELPDAEFDDLLAAEDGAPDDAAATGDGQDARVLPGVVVGVTLAENLGLELGDVVKVISPLSGLDTTLWRPDGGAPKSRDFRVLGVFEAGFQEYDAKLVYMDLFQAQAFQDQGDTVVGVEISLHDIERASDVALRLERDLGGGPFHTMDWKELNNNLFTALEMQKVMLSLVIATIILVAAFNVIATLIMIVLEKRREIAILKAMGARDSAILRIFMVQGAAIGVVGTGIGLVLGGLVCGYLSVFEFPLDPKVYLINHLPVRTSPTEFVITTVIALLICVSSTIIPSWWAARMLPADGVRPQ